jgi:hypothetical protein
MAADPLRTKGGAAAEATAVRNGWLQVRYEVTPKKLNWTRPQGACTFSDILNRV